MSSNTTKKIIILDSIEGSYVNDSSIENNILKDIGRVELVKVSSPDCAYEAVQEADGIISWHLIPLTTELIEKMHNCKAIVRAAVGFNNIDLQAIRKKNIVIANVPDYGTEEVADHTLALLLAINRKLRVLDISCRENGWGWQYMGEVKRLRDSIIGIIGLGRIGKAVSIRAKSFGLDVRFYDPYVESGLDKALGIKREEKLESLLEKADYISLHVPLNDETKYLINKLNIYAIKKGAIIINTCRGSVIEEQALLDALKKGHLSGAGLDVLEHEPNIPEDFQNLDNVMLSGHGAFYSDEALLDLRAKASTTLKEILLGGEHRDILVNRGAM